MAKKIRKIRKITKEYLEKAAFYYLGRYASGEGNLRHILLNKIKRAEFSGSEIPVEASGWIEDVVTKCSNLGLASDKTYAEMKVKSLLNQGKSLQRISIVLRQKRIAPDVIEMTLSALGGDDVEIDQKSALKYAKKRRFGPFRNPLRQPDESDDLAIKKRNEKELGAMIRAGFSYKISKEILDDRSD